MAASPTPSRRDYCVGCGYIITQDQTICPECGRAIDWDLDRAQTPIPRHPRTVIVTLIACAITLVVTCMAGLAASVEPAGVIAGVVCALALELLIIAGFGAMIRAADPRPDKAIARWWIALAPIWLASMVSLAPIPFIDWIMRAGAPPRWDAQDGLSIFFACVVFNAFTIVAAVICACYLWGPLAFGTSLRRWPTQRGVLILLAVPASLLALIAIVSPTAAVGLAVGIGVPVFAPLATGFLLGISAMPHPPRDLGTRGADGKVTSTIGFAIAFSAIACAVFNFWWYKACV